MQKVDETKVSPHYTCLLNIMSRVPDPRIFEEVVVYNHWLTTMKEEFDALESNNTWEITHLLVEKNAIRCKWIYTTKYDHQGESTRYKSRLVRLGNGQGYEVHYEETFAPVAKLTIVRSLLAIAALKGRHTHQMDVKNVFLRLI